MFGNDLSFTELLGNMFIPLHFPVLRPLDEIRSFVNEPRDLARRSLLKIEIIVFHVPVKTLWPGDLIKFGGNRVKTTPRRQGLGLGTATCSHADSLMIDTTGPWILAHYRSGIARSITRSLWIHMESIDRARGLADIKRYYGTARRTEAVSAVTFLSIQWTCMRW